jgi:uncharacterized membrane protein
MIYLIAGLLLFIANHSIRLLAPAWRQNFIDNYGANTWKVLYSVFALTGLALIVFGYGLSRDNPVFVWNPPLATRHGAILLTWIAFVLFAAAGIKGNHFKARLGHPMYAGVKIWAFAHLIANGRLGDVVLFTAFMLWAVAGFSFSRRRDRAQGITHPQGQLSRSLLTVVAGSVAWVVFTFWLHRILIGVPPLAI